MHRLTSIATRSALALLVAGTLTCGGGDGEGPQTGPSKLALAIPPSASAENGVALAVQPVVQIQDAAGQATPSSGATVAVEVVESGATLNGTLSKDVDSQGKATFSDLSLTGPAGTYTLKFTSSGLTGVTSSGLDLSGVPSTAALTVTTQPPSTALTVKSLPPPRSPR